MATLITLERLNLAIKNLQSTVTSLVSRMPTKVSQLVNDSNYMTTETTNKLISTETARAKEAEESLADSISSNEDNLAAEIKRATSAEQANTSSINTLQSDLAAEVDRAKTAESTNSNNISSLKTAVTTSLNSKVNSSDIVSNTKAQLETIWINSSAPDIESELTTIESVNATKIENEITRAKAAEEANATNITNLTTKVDGLFTVVSTW